LILDRQVGSIVSLLELKLLGNKNEADSVCCLWQAFCCL
jgi:hypothetical protein